uniref:FAT domain-containing protein n=1 Tax=Panagrellus redivivus TaxID=6233 RepID=A0A7E4VP27_PANRE
MATNARNYLSDDNQIPCSSNNYGYQPLYPASNPTVATPHSPYCHSSGPPSVSMTPATPFMPQPVEAQGHVPPAYTQSWLHNYHDAPPVARPHSSAQSVMSDMTMFSGISVNTHATTASYAMPPGMIPPPGPLSSRSHSENIDPSDDNNVINQVNQVLPYMLDETVEVRGKSANMLIQIPDTIKITEFNQTRMSEVVINCMKAIVRALANELNPVIKVLFSDALFRFANKFPNLFGKVLMIEPNRPDNALRILLGFYKAGAQVDQRFLRHLFPALYVCTLTPAGRPFIQAAKNTNFVWFIFNTVRDNFATSSKIPQMEGYQARMKFFARYLEVLRYFIRFDDNIRLELVKQGLIELLVHITQFHCGRHVSLQPKFLTHYHNNITAMLKLIVTTDSNEITDAFVKSHAIEVLLIALCLYRRANILNHYMLTYTFTTLAYVGHSNLEGVMPRLPIVNIDLFDVIQFETQKSQETQDFELFKLISDFVVNASRYPVIKLQIINSGHHEILADNFFRLYRLPDKKFRDVSDNCLLTLYRLCSVNVNDPMHTKFCQMFFSPRFTSEFVKVFSPDVNITLIKRALNIWKAIIPNVRQEIFFEEYNKINYDVIKGILDLLKVFVTTYKDDSLVKLCVELLLMLMMPHIYFQQFQYLNQFNLVALLYEVKSDEGAFWLLELINKLTERFPDIARSCISSDMLRDFLVTRIKSPHVHLSGLSKHMLNTYYNSYNSTF